MLSVRKETSKTENNIYPIQSMKQMLPYCHYNSFVLFDLDNTVMQTKKLLGSDQWFTAFLEHACTVLSNKREAVDLVLAVYHEVQQQAKAVSVEKTTLKIIKLLQEIGIPVIAITARGPEIIDATIRQLNDVGIAFSKQWEKDPITLTLGDKHHIYFDHGILFCDGHEKGLASKAFFNWLGYFPDETLMIEDKLKHLLCVQRIVNDAGKHFVGLRYGYLDTEVASLNMLKATKQLLKLCDKLPTAFQEIVKKLQIDLLLDAETIMHHRFFNSGNTRVQTVKHETDERQNNNVIVRHRFNV